MAITAILVTYNSAHVVANALACVRGHPLISACNVVDNASTDDTVAAISADFPQVNVIRNKANMGFGAACNHALAQVATPYALLLNPDAMIDAAGIGRLYGCLQAHPNAAIAAPMLGGNDFDASTAATRLPIIRQRQAGLLPTEESDIFKAAFVSGAIALWRMEAMKAVGFFDPAFFLFYEDDDLSLRVRKAGYEMLLVSGIAARHIPGTSCAMNTRLELLKGRSSIWSYLAIHRKYRGKVFAACMALSMLARSGYYVAARKRGGALHKIDHLHRLWGAWYFLRNPKHFQGASDAS